MTGRMTSKEIFDTFNDREALDLEIRQMEISSELRLGRAYIHDISEDDQALLNTWVEDLLQESRENTDRIREILTARSESIGMKVR